MNDPVHNLVAAIVERCKHNIGSPHWNTWDATVRELTAFVRMGLEKDHKANMFSRPPDTKLQGAVEKANRAFEEFDKKFPPPPDERKTKR